MEECQKTIGDTFTYMGTMWTRSCNILYDLRSARGGGGSSEYYGMCTDIDVETTFALPWKIGGEFLNYYLFDPFTHAYNIHVFVRTDDTWGLT